MRHEPSWLVGRQRQGRKGLQCRVGVLGLGEPRQPFPLGVMLRICCLQQWYRLDQFVDAASTSRRPNSILRAQWRWRVWTIRIVIPKALIQSDYQGFLSAKNEISGVVPPEPMRLLRSRALPQSTFCKDTGPTKSGNSLLAQSASPVMSPPGLARDGASAQPGHQASPARPIGGCKCRASRPAVTPDRALPVATLLPTGRCLSTSTHLRGWRWRRRRR